MPLVTRSLQTALSARGLLLSAHVRSCARPCAVPPTSNRSVRCLASSDRSDQPNSGDTSSRGQGFGKSSRPASSKKQKAEVSSTAEALIQSLGEVSSTTGRDAGSTNMVLGTNDSIDKWRQLDEKVNQYPGKRDFKAIGSGGDDFKQTIVQAVEAVVGPVREDRIFQRPSSQGKFVSVTLQDVSVQNPDQVLAVYEAMRKDKRLRYYL